MKKYFGQYASSGDVQTALDGLQLVNPYVAVVENDTMDYDSKEPDYTKMYLTFEILTGGTIKWEDIISYGNPRQKTIEYSKNGGSWVSITSNTGASAPTIDVKAGDVLQFRGDNSEYGGNGTNYTRIGTSQNLRFNAFGNIMSIIDSTGYTSIYYTNSQAFNHFFYESNIVNAENLILPATSLGLQCYNYMFSHCTYLVTAPSLPATQFEFTSYMAMFEYTSIVKAPELLATTLGTRGTYQIMFSHCANLNYIKCLATDFSGPNCTNKWVEGVSATGTFVKASGVTWEAGISGIPDGWTVIEE